MVQPRTPTLVLLGSMFAAFAFGLMSPDVANAGDPCKHPKDKDFNFSEVKTACTKAGGGKAAAKDAMTALVKRANEKLKADGKDKKFKCKDCHSNTTDFELKDDAPVKDLKALL